MNWSKSLLRLPGEIESERRDQLRQKRAEIARCWIKYCLILLEDAKKVLEVFHKSRDKPPVVQLKSWRLFLQRTHPRLCLWLLFRVNRTTLGSWILIFRRSWRRRGCLRWRKKRRAGRVPCCLALRTLLTRLRAWRRRSVSISSLVTFTSVTGDVIDNIQPQYVSTFVVFLSDVVSKQADSFTFLM